MPDNLHDKYNRQQLLLIAAATKRIQALYERAITEISVKAGIVNLPEGKTFYLSSYPFLEKEIERQMRIIHDTVYREIIDSIEASWDLSNLKNDEILDRRWERLGGRVPTRRARAIMYDPNKDAMKAFTSRTEKGLNLSKRVWNLTKPFKKEMELGLGIGISEGKNAPDIARQVKRYLNEPDRLYRRVREIRGDKDSKLKLSKAAMDYHPGRGVYRSSYKNALRLTRTETNMAYQTSDFTRWNKIPIVVGYEIRLSNRHPVYDICDNLKGKYPKTFKFVGWHPQCLCTAIPIQITDEEFDANLDQILDEGKFSGTSVNLVVEPPASFVKYVADNKERINRWGKKPYWVRDNKSYISE